MAASEWEKLRRTATRYKEMYPPGTRVVLNHMEDPWSPVPTGTRGTVAAVDAIGQIHMKWDNGRSLALVPGVDSFRKLTAEEIAKEELEIIFTFFPYKTNNAENKLMDEIEAFFDERDAHFVSMTEVLDGALLDEYEDYLNRGHTNYYGATKLTWFWGDYLYMNYDLPDRREDDNISAILVKLF